MATAARYEQKVTDLLEVAAASLRLASIAVGGDDYWGSAPCQGIMGEFVDTYDQRRRSQSTGQVGSCRSSMPWFGSASMLGVGSQWGRQMLRERRRGR